MGTLFKDSDGKTSMMRFSTFIVVVSVMGVFVGHNIVSMIHVGLFISLGVPEAMLIAGVLGMKSVQSFYENKSAGIKLPDSDTSKVVDE